jgi:hypothetical protein
MTHTRVPVQLAAPTAPRALTLAVRVVGAALLVAMAWIHLKLWLDGYDNIKWIGPLFLLNVVLGALAAIAVLLAPSRWLALVCLLAGLLELGTLGALVLSLTTGFLGFHEFIGGLVTPTIIVEAAGFLVLAGFGGWQLLRARQGSARAPQ